MLSLPNVRVDIEVAAVPWVLDADGREAGRAQFRVSTKEDQHHANALKRVLAERDWKHLREGLLNINFSEAVRVISWLNATGYFPESALNRILPARFWPEQLTPKIIRSLKSLRDAVQISMVLPEPAFAWAVRKALNYGKELSSALGVSADSGLKGRPLKLRHPARQFLEDLAKRSSVRKEEITEVIRYAIEEQRERDVASELEQIFRCGVGGFGLRASFAWNEKAVPLVTVQLSTPAEAIRFSVASDRHFSKSRTVCCPCGKFFDQKRGIDRFCSDKCRNYFTTRQRRTKIRLLQDGELAWEKLSASRRRGQDQLQWITSWAVRKGRESDAGFTIEADWAQKELNRERKAGI